MIIMMIEPLGGRGRRELRDCELRGGHGGEDEGGPRIIYYNII